MTRINGTKAEATNLMALIKANYPSYHAKTDKETILAAVNIMTLLLTDIAAELATVALFDYMGTENEFPPNVGQLIAICDDIKTRIEYAMRAGDIAIPQKNPVVREYILKRKKEIEEKLIKNEKEIKKLG
ncbi:MAG: replicative helicase loader/inhibitor [Oscillospiraceae bacterium]